jgi:hypothetical protein
VPSKIFEYANLGLPMLYFGGGEGEDVIKEHKLGWIAEAGDYDDLNRVILSIKKSELNLDKRKQLQQTAVKYFDFNKQLETLIGKL